MPVTEWCQRYLPCYLLSVSNSVCFSSIYRSLGRTRAYLWLWAAPAPQRTVGQYRTTDVAENVGKFLSGAQRTAQWIHFEVILTVKTKTKHPVEGTIWLRVFGICNQCRVMMAWSRKTWKFCVEFLYFVEKWSLSNCRYSVDRTQNLPGPSPHVWLTIFQISSKLGHFWQSYCQMREHRLCLIEYLQ